MPQFNFITIQDGAAAKSNLIELPTYALARRTAADYTAELVREYRDGIFEHDVSVEVTDESGLVLWIIVVAAVTGAAAPKL